MLAELGTTIFQFGLGLVIAALFLICTSWILMLAPGFALKIIGTIALGIGCFFAFQWLAPEFSPGGTRASVESDLKSIYESAVEIGKTAEFDLLGDYRYNKWRNEQREKRESGYYRDNNGLYYYYAQQDKEYYQRPNGKWQEFGSSHTLVDNPFETPGWQNSGWKSLTSIDEISGFWKGASIIAVPADTDTGSPASNVKLNMYIIGKQNSVDFGFNFYLGEYIDAWLDMYPEIGMTKEQLWSALFENSSKKGNDVIIGKYILEYILNDLSFENFLKELDVQINHSDATLKTVLPGSVFEISGAESLECILSR